MGVGAGRVRTVLRLDFLHIRKALHQLHYISSPGANVVFRNSYLEEIGIC